MSDVLTAIWFVGEKQIRKTWIAYLANLEFDTVNRYLALLEKRGLIEAVAQGKTKKYGLTSLGLAKRRDLAFLARIKLAK